MLLLVACAPVASPTSPSAGEAAAPITETAVIEETASVEATPTAVNEEATSTPAPETATNSGLTVAILVVDFFGTGEAEGGGGSQNCLISPSGAYSEGEGGGHGSTGATNGLVTTNVAHGELVYSHLKQLFNADGLFTETSLPDSYPGLGMVEYAELPEGNVYLVKVDIGDNFTDNVLTQIEVAREILMGYMAVDYVVVNMSVVIKPCGNLFLDGENTEQYIQFVRCIEALGQIQDYFAAIGFSNEDIEPILRARAEVAATYYVSPVTGESWGCPGDPDNSDAAAAILSGVAERSGSFVANLPEDPLYNAMQGGEGGWPGGDIFYIAASGNDGYTYPYAPAIFRQVVSTGSFPSFGYVPNGGEWILGGEFEWLLPVGAEATLKGDAGTIVLGEGETITLGGTSFAAPKLSFLTAMAILRSVDVLSCYPYMIYAADILPPNLFDWGSIDWANWDTLDWDMWPPLDPTTVLDANGNPIPHKVVWQNLWIGDLEAPCTGFLTP